MPRWVMEKELHWVPDVRYGEDASRVRTRHAPQNMASLRNRVIAAVHLNAQTSITSGIRRSGRDYLNPLSLLKRTT